MVCRDAHPTPNALVVSGDSLLLAFVGPSKYVVTVVSTASLEEVSQLELSVCLCWPGRQTPWGSSLGCCVTVLGSTRVEGGREGQGLSLAWYGAGGS